MGSRTARIQLLVEGVAKGFAGVDKEVDDLGDSFGEASVKQELLTRKSQAYDKHVKKLADDVRAGKISMDQATKSADKLGNELGIAGKTTKKAGNRFTELSAKLNIAKQAWGGISQAMGKAIEFGKESIALFGIQAKAEAQLAAVIKSTGSAAGVTAKEMREYAGELQNMTTFGDEAIIGAESLLLTFTNIGGPVLKEATATVLDMSQALGQDLKSSSVQVGKALNDPILGITALSRVGVSFTAQQKEQIKTMTELGDVTGAQQIILAELSKEFGGSAAAAVDTYDGKLTQLSNVYGDLQEEIGQAIASQDGFLDTLTKGLSTLTSNTAMWNDLQNAMDAGFFSQEQLAKAHAEGNEALAELADEYLRYLDVLELATAQAESSDRVLRGLEKTLVVHAGAWGDVTEAESEQMQVASEAAFANSELSDKIQQQSAHLTENETLVRNANAAMRDFGNATSSVAGPLADGISLTERINQEIDRLNNQPKSFNFALSVSGLESLREGIRLMGQMGGGIDFDPFALGGDAGVVQNLVDDALDRGADVGAGTPAAGGGSGNVNLAHGVSNFTVPPGFPNDTFKVGLTSGELLNVTPAGKNGNGSEGGFTLNGPLIGNVTMNPGENVNAFASRLAGIVSEEIGRLG